MSNNPIILEQFLEADRTTKHASANPSEHFEIFCADQILKDYELANDEIKAGIVGSSRDGGIDAVYTFLDRTLVHEDSDFASYKRGVAIELIFIQAKTSDSFSESTIDKFQASSCDLLDLAKDLKTLESVYNHELISAMARFRTAYKRLVTRFPKLTIKYYYASKGDRPHPNVERKANTLKERVNSLLSDASVEVEFLGAKNLLDLARKQASSSYNLEIAEAPISAKGDVAFVCIARLDAYRKFISDEKGNLHRNIFEANVRDYQGRSEVNEAIAKTLISSVEDFWWLNNGVTILCSKATHSSKVLTIENPEVVNGLQTSRELHNFFSTPRPKEDSRHILVRVIRPASPESRDQIIKATNSQTTIPTASLRSTDKIHRDIEDYFRSIGLFYDRRKNFYKNSGESADKIISIPYLAQSVMAIALQRPDTARARPSSLLKKDDEYKKVFSEKYPIELYEKTVATMRGVDSLFRARQFENIREQLANLHYYVGLDLVVSVIGKLKPTIQEIANLDLTRITEENFRISYSRVHQLYDELGATDQIAKGSALLSKWIKHMEASAPKKLFAQK